MATQKAALTEKQAVDKFLGGGTVILCVYHTGRMETVNYRDKVTRNLAKFTSLRHTVLTDMGALVVSERVEDENAKPEDYASPFKRGSRVLVNLTKLETNNGVIVVQGSIEAVGA